MKNKILTFIIGLLVGAIITTAIFFVYLKVNKNENTTTNQETHQMQMPGGERGEMTPPDMQEGETESTDGNTTVKRTKPTKQDGANTDNSSRPTPPDMQNGESQKPSEESQESNNNA